MLLLFTFITGVGFIYFTTHSLPWDYNFPKIQTQKGKRINVYELNREFLKFFPQSERKRETTTGVKNLPSPLEVLAFSEGNPAGVLLKAGKEIFFITDRKPNKGWKLVGFTRKEVILEYDGREVRLPLPKVEKEGRKKQGGGVESWESRTVSRELVNRLMQNYGQLLRGIDIVPYEKDGETVGMKIRYLSPSSIFYKLGFRIGDVILSVNGVKLRNTEDLFRVVQIIRNEPNIKVEILRRGRPYEIDIRIE